MWFKYRCKMYVCLFFYFFWMWNKWINRICINFLKTLLASKPVFPLLSSFTFNIFTLIQIHWSKKGKSKRRCDPFNWINNRNINRFIHFNWALPINLHRFIFSSSHFILGCFHHLQLFGFIWFSFCLQSVCIQLQIFTYRWRGTNTAACPEIRQHNVDTNCTPNPGRVTTKIGMWPPVQQMPQLNFFCSNTITLMKLKR